MYIVKFYYIKRNKKNPTYGEAAVYRQTVYGDKQRAVNYALHQRDIHRDIVGFELLEKEKTLSNA